jgi:hypothetical protein
MYWDAVRPPALEPEFTVECGRLRPGVPVVRARGRLNRVTGVELHRAVHRCLEASPWAVVVDLTEVTELRVGAPRSSMRHSWALPALHLMSAGARGMKTAGRRGVDSTGSRLPERDRVVPVSGTFTW